MKFVVTIHMNKTSMRNGWDIARVLKDLAMKLETDPEIVEEDVLCWTSSDQLKDVHNQKVGEWELL